MGISKAEMVIGWNMMLAEGGKRGENVQPRWRILAPCSLVALCRMSPLVGTLLAKRIRLKANGRKKEPGSTEAVRAVVDSK
jgi:hypothetical protein